MFSEQYIIVGFGVFGASTALEILKSSSKVKLTIISDHRRKGQASNDISKIVRIDYDNPRRMQEAIRAWKYWQTYQPFMTYYQAVGRLVRYPQQENLDHINNTRLKFGLEKREVLRESESSEFYVPATMFKDSILVWNADDGLVEWEGCVDAMKKIVLQDERSEVIDVPVSRLQVKDGQISTIVLEDGQSIEAESAEIIVAAGAWTSELLYRSNIEQPPISRRPIATGLFAFRLQLDQEQKEFFKGKPPFSDVGHEFLPPTKDDGIAKITWIKPFTNITDNSKPSQARDLSGTCFAVQSLLEAVKWARKTIPQLKGAKVIEIVSYWDGVTQTQEPLIVKHPEYNNLCLAAGGSYTRAKDAPTCGEQVLDAVQSRPVSEYGWFPTTSNYQDHPHLRANYNFMDLESEAERDIQIKSWKQARIGCIDDCLETV